MRAVFDATVFVRALVDREQSARDWVRRAATREITVTVPDLVFAEVGHALARYVRSTGLSRAGAVRRLELAARIPQDVRSVARIAPVAVGVALERGLSVYDSCYAVLAEAEDVRLVTADRALASAVARAELLP